MVLKNKNINQENSKAKVLGFTPVTRHLKLANADKQDFKIQFILLRDYKSSAPLIKLF